MEAELANVALLLWPIAALFIFAHAEIVTAVIASTVIPYLFLPEAFAIEMAGLPDLDKVSIISIGLVGGLVFYGKRALGKAALSTLKTESRIFRFAITALLAITLIGVVLTVMNNRETLYFGPTVLPAMRTWDALAIISDWILLLIPYFVARRYFATPSEHRTLLKAFVISGLFYSILMLIEIRLSPQLHNWIYGYHQHSFLQHIRDGFRPMVFLQHGIWVGFFMFMALMSAVALWKVKQDRKWMWAAGWIFVMLMISKNLGAFSIALLFLAVFFGIWRKMQIWVVIMIALITLTYPAVRQLGIIPTDRILTAVDAISEDRANSLAFRLRNEDQLLERALQKPLTGWGGWGRDRIYDARGENVSVTDGRWIIVLGGRGWIGYVGLFGLLTLPLITLARTARRKELPPETIALALICAGNLIYLIPNSTLTPIGLLCFGALAGFAQFDLSGHKNAFQRVDRYTRFSETRKRSSQS